MDGPLVLQTIYVLNKEILHLLSLTSAVYSQEQVIMARARYIKCILSLFGTCA